MTWDETTASGNLNKVEIVGNGAVVTRGGSVEGRFMSIDLASEERTYLSISSITFSNFSISTGNGGVFQVSRMYEIMITSTTFSGNEAKAGQGGAGAFVSNRV